MDFPSSAWLQQQRVAVVVDPRLQRRDRVIATDLLLLADCAVCREKGLDAIVA